MKILEYDASFGEIAFPEGFEKELEGRSVEEQLRCFALTVRSPLWAPAMFVLTWERLEPNSLNRFP